MVEVTRAAAAVLNDGFDRAITRVDRRRLVRVYLDLPLLDPLAVLSAAELDGLEVVAWSDPGGTRSFVGIGVAWEAQLTGSDRFAEASEAYRTLCSDRLEVKGAGDELPLVFAGFAFSACTERSARWRGFGDGRLIVPQILVHREGDRVRAALSAEAMPGGVGTAARLTEAADLLERLLKPRPVYPPSVAGKNGMARAGRDDSAWTAWRERVEGARDQMRGEVIDKVVLARTETFETLDGQPFDALGTAMALAERQVRCTTYVWRMPDGRAMVGSSPEKLATLENGLVETVALAGTRRRGWDNENDATLGRALMESGKDRREQALVTAAIEEALSPISEELHVPPEPEVARFADVQHLRTPIRARLRSNTSVFELVERLHPTPAVGGLPGVRALAWLDAHEGLDRGWYAGPLGWLKGQGEGTFIVAIRSALLDGPRATAYAGCGLVERSDARAEWRETIAKLEAITQGLALVRRETEEPR